MGTANCHGSKLEIACQTISKLCKTCMITQRAGREGGKAKNPSFIPLFYAKVHRRKAIELDNS